MRKLVKVRLQTVLTGLAIALGVIGMALMLGGMGPGGGSCGTPETGACCERTRHGAPKGEFACSCTVGVPCPATGSSHAECCTTTCSGGVCQ